MSTPIRIKTKIYVDNDGFLLSENKCVSLLIYVTDILGRPLATPGVTFDAATFSLFKSPNINTPVVDADTAIQGDDGNALKLTYQFNSETQGTGAGLYLGAFDFTLNDGTNPPETFRREIKIPVEELDTGVVPDPTLQQYTDEQAQDAVGGILTDSTTIAWNYDDATPEISASLKAGSITDGLIAAGVDATKIANGTVSNTEFQYIGTLSANAQDQIDGKEPTIATLPVGKGGTGSNATLNNNRLIISSGDVFAEAAAIAPSRALVGDANGIPVASVTTATEITHVNGVTSPIQPQLNARELVANKGAANGYASLDGSGKIPNSQLPPLAITETFVVNSQAAQLALTSQEGDVAVRTDLNKSYIRLSSNLGTMADWQELLTPTDAVLSVFGRTGVIAAATNDYTWNQINKAVSDIADIATRSHASLTNIGTLTHAQLETAISGKEPSFSVLPIAKGGTNSGSPLNSNRLIVSIAGAIVERAAITPYRLLMTDANGLPQAQETKTTSILWDDWINNTSAGALGWTGTNRGTGSAEAMSTYGQDTTYKAQGVVRIPTGTTTTGRCSLHLGTDTILIGNGVAFNYYSRIAPDDSALSDAGNPYRYYIGFCDNTAAGAATDGVMLEYIHTTSPNFVAVCVSNGTRTEVITTVPVSLGVFYDIDIEINSAGNQARFFINSSLVATITTNIPTGAGRFTAPAFKVEKLGAGAASRVMYIDKFQLIVIK